MKKSMLCFIVTLSVLISALSLFGCNTQTGGSTDYNADIKVVAPADIHAEHFVAEEGKTYYTSPGLSLWMEVNGAYLKLDYFYLDGNKRVYDNLPFYKDDYFLMASSDLKGWYAALSDSADAEYAETETDEGEDIQINIKKAGIYKLIFDVDTLKFDLEYQREIETPMYYTMKDCSIYSVATDWVEMSANPENEDEFVIRDFSVEAGKTVSFYSNIHTSNYKVTLDAACDGKYASARKASVTVNVGGRYDIYINKKTYVVRTVLINPDTATYSCVHYDGNDFLTLQPQEANVPYIFRHRIVVDTKYSTLPDFYTANYRTYQLAVVDTEELLSATSKNHYFKNTGTYDLIINLKTFEITVTLLPE